jgi:shikimate dehydrogenase
MKFGLIGHPIEHSLSPALFKAGYDGMYPYDLIITEDFEEAYRRFLEGYDGINVTAPFKEQALRKADIVSEECDLVGATNLLVKTPDGVTAYNSDFRGLISILNSVKASDEGAKRTPPTPSSWAPPPAARGVARFSHPHPKPQNTDNRILIVGAGGAGKAAKAAAEALGYKTTVVNRTQYGPEIKPLSSFREEFRKADIVIYNLPVRIPEVDMLTEEDLCSGQAKVILEANYRNPSFDNGSIKRMVEINPLIRYIDGLEWLLQQAVTGYELFTGKAPDSEAMKAVIKSK